MNRHEWRVLKRKISNAILDALFPLKCARCQGIVKRADAIKAQSTMGVWADVCPPCHRELYPSMYPKTEDPE